MALKKRIKDYYILIGVKSGTVWRLLKFEKLTGAFIYTDGENTLEIPITDMYKPDLDERYLRVATMTERILYGK